MPTSTSLLDAARAARLHAHAPFSHFLVGAALETADGQVVTGCNVENATYGLTICAERVAVFKAVSEGEREFSAIAVVTRDGGTPCGSCRQVLAEFSLDAQVLVANEAGEVTMEGSVLDLLPGAFGPENLKASL